MIYLINNSDNKNLENQIKKEINCNLLSVEKKIFSCNEYHVKINEQIKDQDKVIIIQSVLPNANDKLFELLITVNALQQANAKNIILLMPYLAYSRQNCMVSKFSSIGIKVIADLLKNIQRLITIDIHSNTSLNTFDIPVTHITTNRIFSKHIAENFGLNNVIVAPDIGAIYRAKEVANLLGVDFITIDKIRSNNNKINMNLLGNVIPTKTHIIVDDIIDTGNTIIEATNLLYKHGAPKVIGYCSHYLLNKEEHEKAISNSNLEALYVTNAAIGHSNIDKVNFININNEMSKVLTSII